MRWLFALAAGLVLTALASLLLWRRFAAPASVRAEAAPLPAPLAERTGPLDAPPADPLLAAVRRALAERDESDAGAAAALSDEELVRALEHLTAVYEFAIPFPRSLEAALAPIVLSRENVERALLLLRTARLGGVGPPSAAERGAVLALVMAASLHSTGGGDPRLATAGIDGERLTSELLELGGEARAELREHLFEMLGGTKTKEGPLLTLERLDEILRLRALHPEAADDYVALLERLGGEFDEDARAAFYALYLSPSESARAGAVALGRLLDAGEDAERLIAWADEKITAASDPLARRELREALCRAIAQHAPPELAGEFLSRHSAGTVSADSMSLGLQPGGAEALLAEYERLLPLAGSADQRHRLVFGMQRAEPDALLGIARDDPDAKVRGQALITLTVAGERGPRALAAVLDAWHRRGGPGAPDPYGTMLAAANLLRRAETEEVRTSARTILVEAVRDTTLPGWMRSQALSMLEGHLPESEFAALEAILE